MKWLKEKLARNYVWQLRTMGRLLKMSRNKSLRAVGLTFTDKEILDAAHNMVANMTLLPTIPGSKRYEHNLSYTIPFMEVIAEKASMYRQRLDSKFEWVYYQDLSGTVHIRKGNNLNIN